MFDALFADVDTTEEEIDGLRKMRQGGQSMCSACFTLVLRPTSDKVTNSNEPKWMPQMICSSRRQNVVNALHVLSLFDENV